jgi:glycosyltransferase involved in cell wall biosynthesis
MVPVLNEEQLLPRFLERTHADLQAIGSAWELILINDGSSDGSLEIMRRFAKETPGVRVLDLKGNYGPGANVQQAYREAKMEFVTYATVDEFYDTAILPGLLHHLHAYDGVSAYRTDLLAHYPLRRVQTLLNVGVQHLLFPRALRFRAYHTLQIHRTDFVQAIELEAGSPFLCTELLFKACALGLRITEVPIPYLPRKEGKATGGSPKLIFKHMKDVFRFWFKWFVLRQPIVRPGTALPIRSTATDMTSTVIPAPGISGSRLIGGAGDVAPVDARSGAGSGT